MATTLTQAPAIAAPNRALVPARPSTAVAAYSLWRRELVRFYRQKARVVGVIASPLIFWAVLGSGFANSFHAAGSGNSHYGGYFFPGSVALIVLFTAIFSMMSLIQDRNEGFLLSVLAAPVSRSAIVLGKVLGGATLAAVQGIVFLVFAPLVGIHATVGSILGAIAVIALLSFELTALGFTIAWPLDSAQAFHAIVNLLFIPLWMLSGALFPASGASPWLHWVMRFNPLTYGVDALRNLLFPAQHTDSSFAVNLLVTAVFCVVCFAASWAAVNRRTHKPAA